MAIIVKCTRDTGDREAPSINDSLITSESTAASRGKRYLDDPDQGAYYLTKKRNLRMPHEISGEVALDHIEPGSWVTVTDSHLGLSNQKLKVKAYNINITPSSVRGIMDTESYEEFSV